jgi:hypothetical protein
MIRDRLLQLGTMILATCVLSSPQNGDPRSGAPVQMQVQLTFSEDQSSEAVPGTISKQKDSMHRDDAGAQQNHAFNAGMQLRVQLQDAFGGTLQEAAPNGEGKLQFTTRSDGTYRLRVTGPTIEEALVEDLQPGRGDRMVNVTLHHKRGGQDAHPPNASISAHDLQVPKKAQAQLDKGDSALKKSQLEAAELHYSKAIEIYPRFAQAENNLGIVLMREGRKEQGKAAFERALLIDSRYAPAQVNLAKIAFDGKRFREAFDLAREALKTEPLNTAALFVATQAAFFSGNYGETISYARTLHSLPHKQYALIHFLAGKSLEADHRPVEAIGEYQTFISEDPTDPNVARARQLITVLQASRLADSGTQQ